jgi:predicted membrane protein
MTGSDLIWIAPWVIFAVCLAVVCGYLFRARRSAKRPPSAGRRDGG